VRVDRLDHLVRTVASIEATVGFYTWVLGMEAVAFGAGRIVLTFGTSKINLHEAGKEFKPKALCPTPGSADLCLILDEDIAEVLAELAAAGVPVEQGPVERTGARASGHRGCCAAGWLGGEYLGHVGVDGLLAGGGGGGYPVMAVADEVQAADAVDLDRRARRTAPLRQRQLRPAFPYPVGGGPDVPVEVAALLGRAGDRVQRYRLQAQVPLAAPPERACDLVERQEAVAVGGLAAQAAGQRGQEVAPRSFALV